MLTRPTQAVTSLGCRTIQEAATGHFREETWREAEARMFRLAALMMRGDLPALGEFSPADRRRLGYMAELAALLLGAPNKADLLAYAGSARRLAPSDEPPASEPFVPGASPGRGPQMDALAAEWGFHPGLDVSRYRAEAPALLLKTA